MKIFCRKNCIPYSGCYYTSLTVGYLFNIKKHIVVRRKITGIRHSVNSHERRNFRFVRISFSLPLGRNGYFNHRRRNSFSADNDWIIIFHVLFNVYFYIRDQFIRRKIKPFARKCYSSFTRGFRNQFSVGIICDVIIRHRKVNIAIIIYFVKKHLDFRLEFISDSHI